jgi:hypothetical protein
MPATIVRYELTAKRCRLSIPQGAIVLNAMLTPQLNCVSLHVLCDLAAPSEERFFAFYATGEELPQHIWDSVPVQSLPNGTHLFEIPERFLATPA